MKKLFNKTAIAMTMAIVMVMSMVTSAFADSYKEFTDINSSPGYAKDIIVKWHQKGYAKGYPQGDFRPNQDVTRAEFCAFANRFLGYFGYPKDGSIKSPFTDVQVRNTDEGWFYDDVAIAAKVGYVQGYQGKFRPNDKMTREEVAAALAQLFRMNLVDQVDGVVGTVDNTVQTALGLVHLDGVAPKLEPLVAAVLKSGLMTGVLDTVTGLINFNPSGIVDRAMIIKIMDNIFIQFPQLLNHGDLLKTVIGLASGLLGAGIQTVGSVTTTVFGLLDAITGIQAANPGISNADALGILGNTLNGGASSATTTTGNPATDVVGTVTNLVGSILGGLHL